MKIKEDLDEYFPETSDEEFQVSMEMEEFIKDQGAGIDGDFEGIHH